jgi:hypothetical protein
VFSSVGNKIYFFSDFKNLIPILNYIDISEKMTVKMKDIHENKIKNIFLYIGQLVTYFTFMLFYSEKRREYKNTPCVQIFEFLNIKPGGYKVTTGLKMLNFRSMNLTFRNRASYI